MMNRLSPRTPVRHYRITEDWPLWAAVEQDRPATIRAAVPPGQAYPAPEQTEYKSPHESHNIQSQTLSSGQAGSMPAVSAITSRRDHPSSESTDARGSTKPPTEPPLDAPVAGNTGAALPIPGMTPRMPVRQLVELWLKREGITYIRVNEAKKALFAGAKLRSFHYVAYRDQDPHWLIWAGNVNAEARKEMLQWQQIFGDGFKAVLARPSRTNPLGFTTKTLNDEPIQW